MLLHSYFAVHQMPLCGGVLANIWHIYKFAKFVKKKILFRQICGMYHIRQQINTYTKDCFILFTRNQSVLNPHTLV